jgi:hypothetical protein
MLTVSSQRYTPSFDSGSHKPIEDHHAQGVPNRCGVAGFAKHAGEAFKSELLSDLSQRPHIAKGQRRLELHLGRGGPVRWLATRTQKPLQQGIDGTTRFINAPDRSNRTLTRFTALVTERLNELDVGVGTRPSELDEHGGMIANTHNQ